MLLTLFWKGEEFQIVADDSDTFHQVIKRFVIKRPKGIEPSRIKDIYLLHDSENVDLDCTISNFSMYYDYTFVVYLSKESTQKRNASAPTNIINIRVELVNICTNERYTQVVSVTSQISQVIDNLRSVLKANANIALFNHNGLLNASETFRALAIENGDMIGILPYAIPGFELLHLKDLSFQRYSSHARFNNEIKQNPFNLLDDLTLSYTYQSPSDFISILSSLSKFSFTTLSIYDSIDVLQMNVNKRTAITSKRIDSFTQLYIPWKSVTTMAINSFFSSLSKFKSIYVVDIRFENSIEPERQELISVLSKQQLPYFILVNNKPFVSVQSYVNHIKNKEISSQVVIQSLKKRIEEMEEKEKVNGNQIKDVIDQNLLLKQDLSASQEREAKLKSELEAIKARVITMEQGFADYNRIVPICLSIQDACNTIHMDSQHIHTPDIQIQRNIEGASNFCRQKIQEVIQCIHPRSQSPPSKRPYPYPRYPCLFNKQIISQIRLHFLLQVPPTQLTRSSSPTATGRLIGISIPAFILP